MTPDQAHEQQNRYFEVTIAGPDDAWAALIGCIVKPLHGDPDDNFIVIRGKEFWKRGDKIYLYTPTLRPLNQKDQRKLEQEVINAASQARRQAGSQEAIPA